MSKWKKVKLGAVCSLYQPKTIPTKELKDDMPYYVYGANGIIGKYHSYNHIDSEIAIACRGATCGAVNITLPKSWITGNAMVAHIESNELSFKYLFYALSNANMKNVITGAAQPQITRSNLKDLEIPLPPMEEQKKIAARLDAVSDLLAKQKQLLSEQDNLIQSLFYDMFGEHQLSQQKEEWNKISDVAVVAGGSTPKTQTPEYWDGDLNWFTPAELENCSWYVYSSQRKITKAGVKSCHLEEFPINTVLLSSRAPIGKLAIARETFYCNQGFKNIICGETVNPIYLYHLLMYNINYMKSLGKGATFKEISKKIVEDIKIPVPPLELQEKFAVIVEQIETEKSKIKSAIAETQTLFNALMAEYFEE